MGGRLPVDKRRQQLLDLGLELFDKQPYDSISIDAIASAAGISKGLLYHYFPGKRAFYVAVVQSAAEQLLAATEAASERTGGTPLERLSAGIDAFLDFASAHADSFRFLMRGTMTGDEQVRPILDRVRSDYASRLLEDGGNELGAEGLVAFAEAVSLRWLESPEMNRQEVRDLIVRVAVTALPPLGT